jgi:hypothetical protein
LPKMKRAARSPIIIVGASVLPETRRGMIDASATRRPARRSRRGRHLLKTESRALSEGHT